MDSTNNLDEITTTQSDFETMPDTNESTITKTTSLGGKRKTHKRRKGGKSKKSRKSRKNKKSRKGKKRGGSKKYLKKIII
jgi:hypothetical protein